MYQEVIENTSLHVHRDYINILANNNYMMKIFIFSDRRHNSIVYSRQKIKMGGTQKNTEGGGTLCHSDRK